VRSRAWRNLLVATFPGSSVRWRDAYGATLVTRGAGIFLPMHGEEAVRIGLMKDRIKGASVPAVAATAGVEGEWVTHAFNSVSATKGALRAQRP